MQIGFTPNVRVTQKIAPKFTGSVIDRMNQPMENATVFKNATVGQAGNFKLYCLLKSGMYDLGMTPDEANELLKFEAADFMSNSYNYLTKKLGIPDEVRPALMPAEFPSGMPCFMQYIPSMNIIQFNIEYASNVDDIDNFQALRHELQHYLQNMKVLRHEEYGEKAIEAYTDNYIEAQKIILDNLYNSNQLDSILQPGMLDDKNAAWVRAYKQLRDCGNLDSIDILLKEMASDYKTEILQFRDKVRNVYGVIKSDSLETSKIERIYNEFKDIGYFKQNREIDYDKYFSTFIEQDAILSQLRAGFELSKGGCFMRFMNDEYNRTMQNDFLRHEAEKMDTNV
ncbi:MAG: hypothetical protein NC191_06005 [Muribaculaceae bacterium]|nr:hypothetical protein [Muribaculaceae bacterium]